MSESNENTKFYDSLKNAQPIAFLASFAMVIAAFSSNNHNVDTTIYNDAVIASVMFISSFMVSLFDQLKLKPETGFRLIHWGKLFFLGIGILYLMGVGWGFAKSIPQISDIFLSWTLIVVGGSGLGTILSSKNKLLPIKFTPDMVFSIMPFLCILAIGLLFLGRQILEQRISAEMWINFVTCLSIGFVISLFLALLFVIKSQKKT